MKKFESLRRALRWHRRSFAAVAAAVAVLATINALSARLQEGPAVLVVSRTIAGGSVIGAEDLELLRVPSGVLPDGVLTDPESAVGRTTIGELPARTVLSQSLLVNTGSSVSPGNLALPVQFGDAETTALLQAGGRIDLLGATSESAYGIVAAAVRVIAIHQPQESALGGSQSPLVLVEVDTAQAAMITEAQAVSGLSFALH